MARAGAASALLSSALLVAAACAPSPPRPSIVLISIDSLRADHLGCYGYFRDTSPVIDSLAAQGLLFENFFSTSSWTLPAHISMLTALLPEQHGLQSLDRCLEPDVTLLPEVLAANGYRTAAIVSGPFLEAFWGYDQGWERYDDSLVVSDAQSSLSDSHSWVTSSEVYERAVAQIDRFGRDPFFLFLHFWDVHYDYEPPAPYDTFFDSTYTGSITGIGYEKDPAINRNMNRRDLDHLIALYDGEIRWVDSWIGELVRHLKSVGRWDETVMIVTSDHGDEFFEHGRKGHKKNLYDVVLQIPLVIRVPKAIRDGIRIRAPASLVDIAPSVAAIAGAAPASSWLGSTLLGRSLEPMIRSEPKDVFADLHDRKKAVIRGPLKLMAEVAVDSTRLSPTALYDLEADRSETRSLLGSRPEVEASLMLALEELRARSPGQRRDGNSRSCAPSDELARELKALGYL